MYIKLVLLLLFGQLIITLTNFQIREEIPYKYKWDLTTIYTDWEEWVSGLKSMGANDSE